LHCQHAEVAYVALSGKPPFWGSPKQQVARMRAEKYPLSGEQGTPSEGWQLLEVFKCMLTAKI